MSTRKSKTKKRERSQTGITPEDLNGAVSEMDRAAIANLVNEAHKPDTESDNFALLLELAVTDPNLDNGAAFTTAFCLIGMGVKFGKMSGTQRQALALDPRVVRAIVPHVWLAFPKETDAMLTLWLKSLVEDHPKLWKSIYARAGKIGPQSKAQKARAGK